MKPVVLIGAALILCGCMEASGAAGGGARIANPASENCIRLGGRLELREEAGGVVGYCHLPDGRVVEEWTLFRSRR